MAKQNNPNVGQHAPVSPIAQEKLASALRENLKKRKMQMRARKSDSKSETSDQKQD